MKILKWSVLGLALLLVGLAVVGLFLPATAHVERHITIAASPAQIFPYANSMRQFNQWSPWYGADPHAEYQYSGPSNGVGSSMRWKSADPALGEGAMTITASVPHSRVDMELDFGNGGLAQSYVILEPQAGATLVTWGFDVNFSMNPAERYFGLMMDRFVGQEYDKGLAQLKNLLETTLRSR